MSKKYWHFLPDGSKVVEVGETIKVEGDPVLYASELITDALSFASGAMVCRVELGGTIIEGDDKAVAQERTVLWMVDATRTLHEFAIWCAEQALGLIENPDPCSIEALRVKKLWLDGKATDTELNVAAGAAKAAAGAAAGAAGAVAGDWNATNDAIRVAEVVAWAARAVAWAVGDVDDVASAAGMDVWAAANAASIAAWAAGGITGGTWTAMDAQNRKLEQMVMKLFIDTNDAV